MPLGNVNEAHGLPLTLASEGDEVRIVALRAGKSVEKRLMSMGLTVNTIMRVVQRQAGGGVVVAHGETRLALGAGIAHKVLVCKAGDLG
jgi:ferrous iron transport protein A